MYDSVEKLKSNQRLRSLVNYKICVFGSDEMLSASQV